MAALEGEGVAGAGEGEGGKGKGKGMKRAKGRIGGEVVGAGGRCYR